MALQGIQGIQNQIQKKTFIKNHVGTPEEELLFLPRAWEHSEEEPPIGEQNQRLCSPPGHIKTRMPKAK